MLKKIVYWVATILLSLMMLLQSFVFTFNSSEIAKLFEQLSVPSLFIIPLGILKFLGVVAILSLKSERLKEYAYYGFMIDFFAAFLAHLFAGPELISGSISPLVALGLTLTSYFLKNHVYGKKDITYQKVNLEKDSLVHYFNRIIFFVNFLFLSSKE